MEFIVLLVLAILVIIFIAKGLRVVPQQSVMIIERLGKFQSVLTSGLNWVIPFIDAPRRIRWRTARRTEDGVYYIEEERKFIDLRENPYNIPQQNVITKDNVGVLIDGLIYFQIADASKAVYEVTDLFQAIEKLAQTSLRSLVGDMDLDDTLSGRDTINSALTQIMDEATDKWGVKVHRVEIQDIAPPKDVQESMEKQMKAERERRATVTEAEGKKAADILTSEGEMQKRINEATGKASEIEQVATATANGIRAIALAINEKGGKDAVNLRIAEQYLMEFGKLAKESNTMIMPSNLADISSIIATATKVFDATKES